MGKLFVLILMILFLIMMVVASMRPPEGPYWMDPLPPQRASMPDDPWFTSEVLESPVPVLVDFSATWCGPCHFLEEEMEKLRQRYPRQLRIVSIDVDEHPDVVGHFNVPAFPTLMLFVHGKIVDGGVGAVDVTALEKMVRPHFLAAEPAAAAAPAG